MRTITKPKAVIQNIINKEQTGFDIANFIDDKYWYRHYGYHLCLCCDVGYQGSCLEWCTDDYDPEALYHLYKNDDFSTTLYMMYADYRKYVHKNFG